METRMGRGEAHCLCWWGFWCRLLVSFWFRNDPKTVVILWFLFVYSPIKLSKRRITLLTIFSITLGLLALLPVENKKKHIYKRHSIHDATAEGL